MLWKCQVVVRAPASLPVRGKPRLAGQWQRTAQERRKYNLIHFLTRENLSLSQKLVLVSAPFSLVQLEVHVMLPV